MDKKVFISGMHSGQNPSAGVGIARSLRKAFPELNLVGVDHWQGSSGLHHESVDEALLLPQWKQINRVRHVEFLREILDAGNIWISGLDVEVYWLAQNFGYHQNLFAPTGTALELTAKPSVKAFSELGFKVPDYISAFSADSEVHSFMRQNSWQCWLKGPYHDAKRITSWDGFCRHRDQMQKDWKTSRLFLQKHIVGNEESICFSANRGKLVAAVHMQKRLITPEGKTWAGRVTPVSPEFFEQMSEVIQGLRWSGGGEIEFTRDLDGKKWIIECNPRFPAWIFGSALSGINLPAKMISSALEIPFVEIVPLYPCFTRVVYEIPAKESVGLPMPLDPSLAAWSSDGGKGKGGGPSAGSVMPFLRDTMEQRQESHHDFDDDEDDHDDEKSVEHMHFDSSIPPQYSSEIKEKAERFVGETPSRVHLEGWTFSRFESLSKAIRAAHRYPEIRIGYSVKTSSTDEHLRHAKACGFLTECISQMEIHRALNVGVPAKEIILNGPGKFWPLTQKPVTDLRMLFCDSVEEFDRVIQIPNMSKVLGFRIQLPKLNSRFGVPVDKIENFQGIIKSVRKLSGQELGFHFHMPSWSIGIQRWKEAVRSLLTWCQAVEQLTDVSVRHLDMGGGFFPSDLEKMDFKWIQETIREALPQIKTIYFEPGRSLTQEGEAVFSRVLDVRRTKDNKVTEIVVDACIAELPLIDSYAHRIFFKSKTSDDFTHLNKGDTKVLGRICMENDVLSKGLKIPSSVELGDYLIFGDAGAYERSMSYDFGRG
ncbi:MAG: hypothetical protein A2622_13435 [Bdellovibrionales bacterium RIFCSPHIGHO2_01_FULL_40_29]|nr:MAG: hypothetical protein A2622_13435 [Bdellovibrionales bacterium RIFCSPHIGHO2_01_FULL_40_29]OFZ34301.1 MAG: hypothetical protein A3D17_04515 [Bdellovibrionales bacterium RIFCSPHIGHO2_02_FULL_40_15]